MPLLERISKTTVVLSALLIVIFELLAHPDITWPLRLASGAGLVGGWLAASARQSLLPYWLSVGIVAPAFLRLLLGREGPVLDLIWLAGLTGSLVRLTSWSRWALPTPWNVLIGGWALALALGWPVLVAREIDFRVAGLSDFGAVNSWGLMTAPHVVAWILFVVQSQIVGALWFEWTLRAFSDADRKPHIIFALSGAATIASLVAIFQGTFNIDMLSTEFWASRLRTTGTMLDANAYGMCAALAAPLAFLAARRLWPGAPVAAIVVFAVNWAGTWLSGSRTAFFLCAMIGTAALIGGVWRDRRSRQPGAALAIGIPIAAAVVLIALLPSDTATPIRRALEIPSGRAGLALLWDRDGYGPIALQMTREYPMTGVGAGSYRVIAPDYWRLIANDALPLDNAQNWWRHQIAEMGIFGGSLIIVFSVLVAWKVLTSPPRASSAAESWTVRGLLLSLGLTSLFGVPTQNPLVLLSLFALVAWLTTITSSLTTPGDERQSLIRVAWVVACVFAILYAAGHATLAAGPLGLMERAQRFQRPFATGTYPPEPLPTNEFRWTGQDARFMWPAKTRWLVLRFWAHHPDIGVRPVHVTVTTPCGVLFDEDLRTTDSMSLGITLPEGQDTVQAAVHVSRTWTPGSGDERQLGVGVVADFVSDQTLADSQHRTLKPSRCGAGI